MKLTRVNDHIKSVYLNDSSICLYYKIFKTKNDNYSYDKKEKNFNLTNPVCSVRNKAFYQMRTGTVVRPNTAP